MNLINGLSGLFKNVIIQHQMYFFRKIFITLLFTFAFTLYLTSPVNSQNKQNADTNIFEVKALNYQWLDSSAVHSAGFTLTNSKYNNIFTYSAGKKIKLAYSVAGSEKWVSIDLPFTELTNDFSYFQADSLLMVKGTRSRSEIQGRTTFRLQELVILFIRTGREPLQVFSTVYGCSSSLIPNDGENKDLYQYHISQKKIVYTDRLLSIGITDNNSTAEYCELSSAFDGDYIYDGFIFRKKEKEKEKEK